MLLISALRSEAWRAAWNVSADELPFGIVTLAGGSDEGQPYNMGAMRYAQTGNQGWLPSAAMPNTFAAQAFDLGDPCGQEAESGFPSGGDGRCCSNRLAGGGGWPCYPGASPHTPQYMGALHPRIKQEVGRRLAVAARAVALNHTDEISTGPCVFPWPLDLSLIHI